ASLGAVTTLLLLSTCGLAVPGAAQTQAVKPGEPTDPKARKAFAEAGEWLSHGNKESAINDYRKANKQDGGHCNGCLENAYKLALEIGDYKTAADVARDWLPMAQSD